MIRGADGGALLRRSVFKQVTGNWPFSTSSTVAAPVSQRTDGWASHTRAATPLIFSVYNPRLLIQDNVTFLKRLRCDIAVINSATQTDKWAQETLTGEIYVRGIDSYVWMANIIYSLSLNLFHLWCWIRLLETNRSLKGCKTPTDTRAGLPGWEFVSSVVVKQIQKCHKTSEPRCHFMTFHNIYHNAVHHDDKHWGPLWSCCLLPLIRNIDALLTLGCKADRSYSKYHCAQLRWCSVTLYIFTCQDAVRQVHTKKSLFWPSIHTELQLFTPKHELFTKPESS